MTSALPLPHLFMVLCVVLSAACGTVHQATVGDASSRLEQRTVKVRELANGRRELVFDMVVPDPLLERLHVEEARAVLSAFHTATLPAEEGHRFRLIRTSAASGPMDWETNLREEFLGRYGPPGLPLPESLKTSPVFLALTLSPRYMGEGVREAARELFSSPVFLSSVALSVLVYFSAWLMPEPVFSKAFVTALTLRLALAVGVLEFNSFARACASLYKDSRAARTVRDLELAAERFGRAVGGTGLRILILVASTGVARGLPRLPEGGLGPLLRTPRFALPEGVAVDAGGVTTVQMAAGGTIIVTGALAGTMASAVGSACSDGSESKDGHRWHHLATNKNDISERSGGPWTPLFERLFAKAEMSLDSVENLVYLEGHKGPHPAEYHSEVYQRLEESVRGCRTVAQCRSRLVQALKSIANDVCSPGSILHQWVTKT